MKDRVQDRDTILTTSIQKPLYSTVHCKPRNHKIMAALTVGLLANDLRRDVGRRPALVRQ
jgi:hypothetical protein